MVLTGDEFKEAVRKIDYRSPARRDFMMHQIEHRLFEATLTWVETGTGSTVGIDTMWDPINGFDGTNSNIILRFINMGEYNICRLEPNTSVRPEKP